MVYKQIYSNVSKMRRNFRSIFKFILLCIITILLTIFLYKTLQMVLDLNNNNNYNNDDDDNNNRKFDKLIGEGVPPHPKQGGFFMGHPKNIIQKRIDWHDYQLIANENKRTGIGEHGKPGAVSPNEEIQRKHLFDQNGFNALLSDKISLNRSVADIRHKDCSKQKYLSELPTVSVVIPFFNEHWTTLLRTCYSVLNRSPNELIVEIILVDDHSTKEFLKEKLDQYVEANLPKVKILRLPKRSGLIVARIAGAKQATGDVLLFLDSHTEANINWLPPLLEPIAENYKICVCPFIDVIAYDTFEYRAQDEGARGAFDWQFYYKRLPLLPDDLKHPTRPFRSPIMAGGLFAISAKFFWELGGYDEGLDIWGGEQYELSFKIWQCGGEMYDAPCSRVGHIYRGKVPFTNPRSNDYLHTNYKRVAEVWMDEYAQYLYNHDPNRYRHLDPGDLTKQRAIREKLKCKPFKWFMENIAFDLVLKYPPVEPPDFASGAIRSLANTQLCIDTLSHGQNKPIGLYSCADNLAEPHLNQFFLLSWHKDIRVKGKTICWDVPKSHKNAPVIFYECHGQQGNQLWRYDISKHWIIQGRNNRCLDFDANKKEVFVNECDENNPNMKWEFGYANISALAMYDKIGVQINS